jgi:hypothetical protein
VKKFIRASVPIGLQVVGTAAVIAGVFLLWGMAIALLAGGVLAVSVGYLFERTEN